jgi:hypothetical protein
LPPPKKGKESKKSISYTNNKKDPSLVGRILTFSNPSLYYDDLQQELHKNYTGLDRH